MRGKKAAGYIFAGDRDPVRRRYWKKRQLERLRELFVRLGAENVVLYVDEMPREPALRRWELERLLAEAERGSTGIFATGSLLDLGEDEPQALGVLRRLRAYGVRVLLLEQ